MYFWFQIDTLVRYPALTFSIRPYAASRRASPARKVFFSSMQIDFRTDHSSSCPKGRAASMLRARSGPGWPSRRSACASNGDLSDLRLSLEDCEQIEILTTRDRRRSRRARCTEAFRRASAGRGRAPALPGREGRDRAGDRERLLLRLRLSRADRGGRSRPDRGGDRARAGGGARVAPRGAWARRGQALFVEQEEPYKVELVDEAEGNDLHSTRRATSPISAAART